MKIKQETAVEYRSDLDSVVNNALTLLRQSLKTHACNTFITPSHTTDYLLLTLAKEEREHFHVLFLTTQNRLIEDVRLFSGTIDGANVYPREVAKEALRLNAAAVILAHNHPSGTITPSQADKQITDKIKEGLLLLDIRMLDHVIVGGMESYSFAENGLL